METATVTARHVRLSAAAKYTGVHRNTLRRMISRGEIHGYRLGTKLILVDLDELDALLRPIPSAAAS